MDPNLSYDDSRLRRLFAEFEPKQRRKVFRDAFRRTGNKVRKVARRNLRGTKLHNAAKMTRNVRLVVFKRDAGFRVTAAGLKFKRNTMHRNRRGKERPVLQWAEPGTSPRYSGKQRGRPGRRRRETLSSSRRYRGRMPRYGFIEKTRMQVEGTIGAELQKEINLQVDAIAKKYGCS